MKQTLRTPNVFCLTLPLEVGMSALFRPRFPMLRLFLSQWSIPAPNAEDPRGHQRYGPPCCLPCVRLLCAQNAAAALRLGGRPHLRVD